jgi:hypothetical protein
VTLHANLAATEEELMAWCTRRMDKSTLPDRFTIDSLGGQNTSR